MDPSKYRQLFLSESRDRIGRAFNLLEQLLLRDDPETNLDLMRQAHSLKGMAATLGYEPIVALAHALEDVLEELGSIRGERSEQSPLDLVAESLACLGAMIDEVERGRRISSNRAKNLERRLADCCSKTLAAGSPNSAGGRSMALPVSTTPLSAATTIEPTDDSVSDEHPFYRVLLDLQEHDPVAGSDPTVRVLGNLTAVGRVVRVHPPQLSVATGRFNRFLQVVLESHLPVPALLEILRCETGIAEVAVHPTQERPVETHPAQPDDTPWVRVRCDLLDRAMESSLQTLVALNREGLASGRSHRSGRETYDLLSELRMVPLESLFGRLRQTAIEAARVLDKQIEFKIEDEGTSLDRALLDSLVDPLVHLIRNAIDHGIEPETVRRAAGKPEAGAVTLQVMRRAERVQIVLSDDGCGIDPERLRRIAVERGLLGEDEAQGLSADACRQLIFRSGFSSRSEIGPVSGRGLGMDIAKRHVEEIGGRLNIESQVGQGTCMTLDLPLSRSLLRSLLVVCGDQTFALPARAVRSVRSGPVTDDPLGVPKCPNLSDCIGSVPTVRQSDDHPGCVIEIDREGGKNNFLVDQVLDERDLDVHPLGPPLQQLRIFAGASVLEDGSIVLVLDPTALDPTALDRPQES